MRAAEKNSTEAEKPAMLMIIGLMFRSKVENVAEAMQIRTRREKKKKTNPPKKRGWKGEKKARVCFKNARSRIEIFVGRSRDMEMPRFSTAFGTIYYT